MPELKRTFSKARMNKDLDERLVPPGEYRDAKNIEIATSEGSNVGTVQNLKGNTEKTAATTTAPTSSSTSHNFSSNKAVCVGAITDEKNDKIYSLIHDGLWFVAQDSLSDTNHLAISSDYILEYDVSNDTYKYVFNDIYEVHTTTSQNVSEGNEITVANTQGIRTGMTATITISGIAYTSKVKHTFGANTGNTTFSSTKVFLEDNIPAHDGSSTAIDVVFKGERILNFNENNKITGINILDDFLFFTDNENEPKKISISRGLAGTGGLAHLPSPLNFPGGGLGSNRTYHTRLYTEIDPFDNIECVTNADGTIPTWIEEQHVTVIKKAPTTPPIIEMSATGFSRKNTVTGTDNIISGNTNVKFTDSDDNLLKPGDKVSVTVNNDVDWRDGDIILATKEEPPNPNVITDSTIRFKVDGSGNNPAVTSPNTLKAGPFTLEILSIAADTPVSDTTWWFALKTKDSLFEFKFVRFAYRYKYTDGEYSPFSPFSEIAFIPGPYQYKAVDGYNLGMTNQLRGLKIKNYLPNLDERPDDVVAVDILFKDEVSPSIYTVKTLHRQDGQSEGLELTWPDLGATLPDDTKPYANKRGELEITSEMIHAVVASNQLIRPYDNVPRKALAQEIIGNRVVYGNYLQNYNIETASGFIKPEFNLSYTSELIKDVVSNDYSSFLNLETQQNAALFSEPRKSVKSLRTYQVGVVYCDEFGRETPVLTDKATGSITIEKEFSDRKNKLQVSMKTDPPSWASHYKYFIKETSDKYHNLAMDRWYNADDGNVWISFPSSERNKVDEETYLILKKAAGSNTPVKEKARYKILAIENEAPDFIKTNKSNIGQIASSSASNYTNTTDHPSHAGDGYPLIGAQVIKLDADAVEGRFGVDPIGDNSVLINLLNEAQLFIKFITSANTISSDSYKITKISKDTSAVDPNKHFYEFTVDTIFSDDIGFLGTSTLGVDHNIQFEKHEIENSPEFDGRFFVKIAQDQALQDNVLTKTSENNYLIKYNVPISFTSAGLNFNNQYNFSNQSGTLSAPSVQDASDNQNGSPPDNYFYYDQDQWSDAAGVANSGNNNAFNNTGLGFYIGTPFVAGNFGGNLTQTIIAFPNGETRNEDYFTGDILGNWCIDNEMAALGGAGRGVHRDNQGQSTPDNTYTIAGTTFFMSHYGRITTNDNARILKDGIDDSGFNKLSKNGRDSSGNNNANTYPSDIHATEDHNVMHLSLFGIKNSSGNSDETSILGNLEMEGQWGFAEAMSTVGTLFRWQDDPDGTIYEITRVIVQENIRNFAGTNDSSSANKRVRHEIKFKHHVSGAEHGFGHGTPNRFHPLVNAVNESGTAVVTVPGHSVIKNAAGTHKEPFNYAGLAPDASNSLNLQVVVPHYVADTDTKNANPNPAVFETEPKESVDLDIYFEASSSYPIEITEETNEMLIPIGSFFILKPTEYGDGGPLVGKTEETSDTTYTITNFTDAQTFSFSGVNASSSSTGLVDGLDDGYHLTITTPHGSTIEVVLNGAASQNATSLTIHGSPTGIFAPHNSKIGLPFSNCIAFGNGVESDTIRDDFNAPTMANGVKASTVLAERYEEERRTSGLIYSGIYNSQSGVNNLNQFIAGEKITKDINPEYGSIQKIYARNGDLLTLCEDRVLKVLASNKDALFNADGNPQLISSTNVLGQAIPFPGEYGISTNPESFASYANNVYFTDTSRGAVMQIKGDGMAPISEVGMSDYFSDLLKDTRVSICQGTYDEKKLNYNLSVIKSSSSRYVVDSSYTTITWSEKAGGWTSFKSYYPEQGVSINNKYYTWKDGSMWEHHSNDTYNSFYSAITAVVDGAISSSNLVTVHADTQDQRIEEEMIVSGTGVSDNTVVDLVSLNTIRFSSAQTISDDVTLTFRPVSSISPIFNDAPTSVKSFMTLNYEGTQSRILENDETVEGEYYNIDSSTGWYCDRITTNKQSGNVPEFIEKEGKWHNYIRGDETNLANLDTSELSVQGIGVPSAEGYSLTGNYKFKFELKDPEYDLKATAGPNPGELPFMFNGYGGYYLKNNFYFIDSTGTFDFASQTLVDVGTTVSGASNLSTQSAIHGKEQGFILEPAIGYQLTPEDLTINGDSGSDVGSGVNLVRTITINEDADGNANTNTFVEKVELSSDTDAGGIYYGKKVLVKVFFNAVAPTADATITFDFD